MIAASSTSGKIGAKSGSLGKALLSSIVLLQALIWVISSAAKR